MHLVFTSYQGITEFGIKEKNETTKDMNYILEEYKMSEFGKEKIARYIELYNQELKVAQERKQLLIDLKENFSNDFLPLFEEENPEFFI